MINLPLAFAQLLQESKYNMQF